MFSFFNRFMIRKIRHILKKCLNPLLGWAELRFLFVFLFTLLSYCLACILVFTAGMLGGPRSRRFSPGATLPSASFLSIQLGACGTTSSLFFFCTTQVSNASLLGWGSFLHLAGKWQVGTFLLSCLRKTGSKVLQPKPQ